MFKSTISYFNPNKNQLRYKDSDSEFDNFRNEFADKLEKNTGNFPTESEFFFYYTISFKKEKSAKFRRTKESKHFFNFRR